MTTYPDPILKPGPLAHFEHGFNRVAVSADGRFIATSDVDMNIVVRQGEEVVFDGNFGSDNDKIRPTERVRGLAFSPGGDTLYIAAGSEVAAIRTTTWMPAWYYEPPRSFGFLIVSPIALDVAATGDVAVAFDNGSIVVWDGNGTKKETIRDNDSPRWMRFVAGGSELVGSDSFSLCKWHPAERKKKSKIVPQSRIFSIDEGSNWTICGREDATGCRNLGPLGEGIDRLHTRCARSPRRGVPPVRQACRLR